MSKKPTILLTNDDGIHSGGLHALWEAMKPIGNVIIVAPDTEKSAVGHAITISDPIRIQKIDRHSGFEGYAVNGTPADCVKIAVKALMDSPPDLVISGINMGANVGNNIIYSGTVSAATEGTMLNIPSIAISLDSITGGDYRPTGKIIRFIALKVLSNGLPEGTLLNVNVPNVTENEIKGFRVTRQGNVFFKDWFEKREDPRGRLYYWMTGEIIDNDDDQEQDSYALRNNYISVTPIHYQLTSTGFLDKLKQWDFSEFNPS